ncbi:MAG TPA: dihydrofolate reductase [Rhodothermales bacterium]
MKPEVVIIAAVAEGNRAIGIGNDLPWHIPEDLRRFKQLTRGYPVLMGRKTFESLIHQFGGPLKDRRNVVLTDSPGEWKSLPWVETYPSIEEALAAVSNEERVFIGGGASVYQQFLPVADRMELTLVEGSFEADTFFPPYEHLIGTRYRVANVEEHPGFRFVTYEAEKDGK